MEPRKYHLPLSLTSPLHIISSRRTNTTPFVETKKKSLHFGANCYFLFPKLSFWLELIQRICLSTYSPLKLPHLEAITCIFKYGIWPREVLTNDRGLEPGWQSETRMKNWARERHERKNVSFALWSKRPRPCPEAMVMSNTVQREELRVSLGLSPNSVSTDKVIFLILSLLIFRKE